MYFIIYIFFLSLSFFSLSQASSITSFLLFIVALPPLGSATFPPQVAIAMRLNEFPDRRHSSQAPAVPARDGGIIDNSAKFELRIGSSISIYDNNCRTFSILIMRSFCFVLFSSSSWEEHQVCALPVPLSSQPPLLYLPLRRVTGLTWKLCHATRIKISSRSSKWVWNRGRKEERGVYGREWELPQGKHSGSRQLEVGIGIGIGNVIGIEIAIGIEFVYSICAHCASYRS